MAIWMPVEPEANELLTRSPLALLIAMLLDQQVPLEKAFSGPLELVRRLGHEPTVAELAEFDPDALADYFAAVRQPAMVRGMCEDYRAAATIDLVHDRESRARGDKVRCPMLVLWGSKGSIAKRYDAHAIWREYCANEITGGPIQSGHYIAEEAPGELLTAFNGFL